MAFEACKADGIKYATTATPERQTVDVQDAVSAGIAKGMAAFEAKMKLNPERKASVPQAKAQPATRPPSYSTSSLHSPLQGHWQERQAPACQEEVHTTKQ